MKISGHKTDDSFFCFDRVIIHPVDCIPFDIGIRAGKIFVRQWDIPGYVSPAMMKPVNHRAMAQGLKMKQYLISCHRDNTVDWNCVFGGQPFFKPVSITVEDGWTHMILDGWDVDHLELYNTGHDDQNIKLKCPKGCRSWLERKDGFVYRCSACGSLTSDLFMVTEYNQLKPPNRYDEDMFRGWMILTAVEEMLPFPYGLAASIIKRITPLDMEPGKFCIVLNRLGDNAHIFTSSGNFDFLAPNRYHPVPSAKFNRWNVTDTKRTLEFLTSHGVNVYEKYITSNPFEDCFLAFDIDRVYFVREGHNVMLFNSNELVDYREWYRENEEYKKLFE